MDNRAKVSDNKNVLYVPLSITPIVLIPHSALGVVCELTSIQSIDIYVEIIMVKGNHRYLSIYLNGEKS
jgi:hypothetical protein